MHEMDLLETLGLLRTQGEACSTPAPSTSAARFQRIRRRGSMRKQKWEAHSPRAKANLCRTPFPSILLSNTRSLVNKLEYIRLDITSKREVRDCCALVFTETWLNDTVTEDAVTVLA